MTSDRASATSGLDERPATRGSDEDAFGRLVEPHRMALHAHCYRRGVGRAPESNTTMRYLDDKSRADTRGCSPPR